KLNTMLKYSHVNGIEIVIQNDGSFLFNHACLKKKGGELQLVNQKRQLTEVEVIAGLDPLQPVVLSFSGKGIIHKKVDTRSIDSSDQLTLLNKVLPNTSLSDFCIQFNPSDENSGFVSVVRTAVLNAVLDVFSENGINQIVNIFLGPFVINQLSDFLAGKEELVIPAYTLKLKNGKIDELATNDFASLNQNVVIESKPIDHDILLPFSIALTYYTDFNFAISNSERFQNIKEEFYERWKFRTRGASLVSVVFLILTINFFIFNHFWDKNNEVAAQLDLNYSSIGMVDDLKKELIQKKEFLENNGMLEVSRTSFYMDRIVLDLPSTIKFTDVVLHPIKKKESGEQREYMLFENNLIHISGTSLHSLELNNWMNEIKKMDWVNNVELLDYKQENAKTNGVFKIAVSIK
ncbi:MAG: hypothetical protein L6Q66_06535, partial [Bacteroidia bacterium]|nr:hypothetical protein [Bacteroidia bacterium]